jgi:hypothetical protein
LLPTPQDGRDITGRPQVYFRELIAAGRTAGQSVFAITNADVRLEPTVAIAERVRALQPGQALFARRIDVSEPTASEGIPYGPGFDFFAMHVQDAARLPDFGLIFGAPWWDHFVPTVLGLMGVELTLEREPFVYHLNHEERWQLAVWMQLGERYAEAVMHYARDAAPRSPKTRRLRTEIIRAVRGRDPLRRLRRAVRLRVRALHDEELARTLEGLSATAVSHFNGYFGHP